MKMKNLFFGSRFCKKQRVVLIGVFLAVPCQGLWAQEKAAEAVSDPMLVKNEWTEVRKSDYETLLSRMPENVRSRLSNDQKAIIQVLSRLLRDKTLAAQARTEKLDQDPKVKTQLAAEIERFYARLRLDQIEKAASEAFAKTEAVYAARALDIYLADKKKYEFPERVNAAHILFDLKKHGQEEGLKLAQGVRAKIVAGEDFGNAAKQYSDDAGSARQSGELGWFSYEEMVPEFAKAAFALKKAGDISEPVLSQFGWHLILFKERKEAGVLPFEEAKKRIMEEQRQKFIEEYRNKEIAKIDDDPKAVLNEAAIDALYTAPLSAEKVKELLREAQGGGEKKNGGEKSEK
jgi:peptidyl-prolyl cis-trans isomerase C